MAPLTKEQTKAARDLLGWRAADLSERAGVSSDTLRSFESGRTNNLNSPNEHAVREALEAAGIQFLTSGEVAKGDGVALKDDG
ncbi:MAG: helix-turn-helix transcriptional regulator [Pseudomonadota bacterium]